MRRELVFVVLVVVGADFLGRLVVVRYFLDLRVLAGMFVRIFAILLRLGGGGGIAAVLAVLRWLLIPDPIKFLRFQYMIGGLFLGFVVGVFIWRLAPELERGEPAARTKATVLLALHLLGVYGWIVGIGIAGLAALHWGPGARWLARRRGELYAEDDDEVRPYWRKNGIDGT